MFSFLQCRCHVGLPVVNAAVQSSVLNACFTKFYQHDRKILLQTRSNVKFRIAVLRTTLQNSLQLSHNSLLLHMTALYSTDH